MTGGVIEEFWVSEGDVGGWICHRGTTRAHVYVGFVVILGEVRAFVGVGG